MKYLLWIGALLLLACVVTAVAIVVAGNRLMHRPGAAPTNRSPYDGNATLAQLQGLPETNLIYPGSSTLYQLANETTGFEARRNPSYAGYGLATNAATAEILAYYQRQLQDLGWTSRGEVPSSTAETSAYAWDKGKLKFRLAFSDQGSPLVGKSPYAILFYIKVRNLTEDGR